jgi:Protein of unknown function (DUF3168)
MTHALLALREAIRSHAITDTSLAAQLIMPTTIFDEPPRGATGVYITFGEATTQDWSSDTVGHAHSVKLHVWSVPGSSHPALLAAERLAEILHDTNLTLTNHRLVLLRVENVDLKRDPLTRLMRVDVTLRALTEAQ